MIARYSRATRSTCCSEFFQHLRNIVRISYELGCQITFSKEQLRWHRGLQSNLALIQMRSFSTSSLTPSIRKRRATEELLEMPKTEDDLIDEVLMQPLSLREVQIGIDKMLPQYKLKGEQIQVLHSPSEFINSLKNEWRNAKRRIFISSLYIGAEESVVIEEIRDALTRNPKLEVSILIDGIRGTREWPKQCSASVLTPLVHEFGERVQIRLYKTPRCNSLLFKLTPKRFNEGLGVMHMKIYGADDRIMLSGANLSTSYFNDRQDRYFIFDHKELTQYYYDLFKGVCDLSYLLQPTGRDTFKLTWKNSSSIPDPIKNKKEFLKKATERLLPLIAPLPNKEILSESVEKSTDTIVYPLAQLSPIFSEVELSSETHLLDDIFRSMSYPDFSTSTLTVASGYLNLDRYYIEQLKKSLAKVVVLAPSPKANGFYGSKGVSARIPKAYTCIEENLMQEMRMHSSFTLKEYLRNDDGHNWTFHLKGLWISLEHTANPLMTWIGSSNFTPRSRKIDLEASAFIITYNPALQESLAREKDAVEKYCSVITRADLSHHDRKADLITKILLFIVKKMM